MISIAHLLILPVCCTEIPLWNYGCLIGCEIPAEISRGSHHGAVFLIDCSFHNGENQIKKLKTALVFYFCIVNADSLFDFSQ